MLRKTYRGRLTIDLGQVDAIESHGIAVLVAADAYARSDGWILQIRAGSAAVRRAFEVRGLHTQLPFSSA